MDFGFLRNNGKMELFERRSAAPFSLSINPRALNFMLLFIEKD
jgi:hypothetical protein